MNLKDHNITLFRSIKILCRIENIPQDILRYFSRSMRILCGIVSIPHNIVMNLNNVMNMEPVGLGKTRVSIDYTQNSSGTLPTLQILRAYSLAVPKLSESTSTSIGTAHLGRMKSTLRPFLRVRLLLENTPNFLEMIGSACLST